MKKTFTVRGSDGNIITIEAHDALTSTLRIAREYAAKKNYPDRFVVFTEKQLKSELTGHRGTDAETEYGMFMSCILRPSFFPSQAALLGAMSAVAMIKGLEEHTDRQLGIGWVSDIYCEGERIGRGAIEGKLDDFKTYEYLIVTFAIRLDAKYFPPRLTDMIKEVFEDDNTSISMIIAKSILNKFFSYYPTLKSSNSFMETYNKKFVLRSKKVKYLSDNKRRYCKVLGVETSNGALVLELAQSEVVKVTSPSLIVNPRKIRIKREKSQNKLRSR